MMENFFLYKTELPIDSGFELFDECHIAWLIAIGIGSLLFSKKYKDADGDKRNRIRGILGILFPLMALFRDIALMMTGFFSPEVYPLHLCNMALWIVTFYLWTGNRFVGVVYVLLCVPAAALALVFPGWTRYPFFNYMHIHDFVSHGLIVAYGWCLVCSKEILPAWKELWKPFLFGMLGYIILYPLNILLGTNYWFINVPSYGSPLVWIYERTGTRWYIGGHFLLCLLVVITWQGFLKWRESKWR